MATPSAFRHFPLGLLRVIRRGQWCVMLWSARPILHSEVDKFRPDIPAGERAKPYWLVVCPLAYLDRTGGAFTVTIADHAQVRGRGFDTWQEAVDFYRQRAQADAGVSVSADLSLIGSED